MSASAPVGCYGALPQYEFIQTEASINHGNSGGPLFNLKGKMIGIDNQMDGSITAILVGSKVMGLKIRVPMQPLMEWVIAKTISRGVRSQAGTYFVRSQMKRRML